jgi:hypothetical protein
VRMISLSFFWFKCVMEESKEVLWKIRPKSWCSTGNGYKFSDLNHNASYGPFYLPDCRTWQWHDASRRKGGVQYLKIYIYYAFCFLLLHFEDFLKFG